MGRLRSLVDRLPVRVKVTLAFTAAMAVLLTAAGGFLYLRVGSTLDGATDRALRSRAGDLTALVEQADSGLAQAGRSPLTQRGENLAQILDPAGRVIDATPAVRDRPLLTRRQTVVASRRTVLVHAVRRHEGEPDRIRVLASPIQAQGRRLIVVVAASEEPTQEAQRTLGSQLLVGGPLLLLVAALVGYGAAAGALRPVESMRRRAADVQAGHPGRRLPVPASGDEVARLGQTLNDMLARLEDAFARERAFVADASHELRTPLTVLKGELELALAHADTVPAFREAVTAAAEETDRVVQLAEDLLVIARSDQGRLPIRRGTVDVRALLEGTAQRFAGRARAHDVGLDVTGDPGLETWADALRLEQALANLVDNGLRHGGGTVTLEAVADPGGGVRITVADDGSGFPPDFLPVALERFTRADAARARGGTGLGLAIVDAIVAAHGGSVTVSNADGGGGQVSVVLPPVGGSAVGSGRPGAGGSSAVHVARRP